MVAHAQDRCTDPTEWEAFAYAAGRDPDFPIEAGLEEMARLGCFGLPTDQPPARFAEAIAAIRAGDDDGRQFARNRWLAAVELVGLIGMLVKMQALLEEARELRAAGEW